MYKLTLGVIEETYPDLDSAMEDCFKIYPEADFSNWNENNKSCWMDIYENNKTSIIIGTIQEVL